MHLQEPITLILLRRWHAGDAEALRELMDRHLPKIREHVERRVGTLLRSRGDIDDYVQDAVLRILVDGPRFEVADNEHFRMLIARVVENTLRDRNKWFSARRRSAAKERPIPASTVLSLSPVGTRGDTPSRKLDRSEKEAWVRLALDLLDDEARELILLREWEGATYMEMAEKLNIKEGAARMRYQRSVAKLAIKITELRNGNILKAIEVPSQELDNKK